MSKHTPSQIPSGNIFWLGVILGGVLVWGFGTKKGRELIQKMLTMASSLEEDASEYFEQLNDFVDKEKVNFTQLKNEGGISGVIEKLSEILPESKTLNKYFEKNGKTLKSS